MWPWAGLAEGSGKGKVLHAPHDCSDPKARPVRMAGLGAPTERPHTPPKARRPRKPCLPCLSRQNTGGLPFTPSYPRLSKYFAPGGAPNPTPASWASHVRPAPLLRAPPRGRSRPAPGHSAREAEAGRVSAVPAFSPRLARAPPLSPGSSRSFTRPSRLSSWAGRGLHTRRLWLWDW